MQAGVRAARRRGAAAVSSGIRRAAGRRCDRAARSGSDIPGLSKPACPLWTQSPGRRQRGRGRRPTPPPPPPPPVQLRHSLVVARRGRGRYSQWRRLLLSATSLAPRGVLRDCPLCLPPPFPLQVVNSADWHAGPIDHGTGGPGAVLLLAPVKDVFRVPAAPGCAMAPGACIYGGRCAARPRSRLVRH